MSKRENNHVANGSGSKRLKVTIPNLTHYRFSTETNAHVRHNSVVPREKFYGRSRVMELLDSEIHEPLQSRESFEALSRDGTGYPLNRCLRVYGAPNSSKRTAALSFAHSRRIDVLELSSDLELEPQLHFAQIFKRAIALCAPVLVVLRRLDRVMTEEFFEMDSIASRQEQQLRRRCLFYLSRELENVINSRLPIWVLVLSDTKPPAPYEVDKFFANMTFFNAAEMDPNFFDLYTDADRAMMLTFLINTYMSTQQQQEGGEFPMSREALIYFCINYTKFCTYRQLRQFIRAVFTDLRYKQNQPFNAETLTTFLTERKMTSISITNAFTDNIGKFL